MKGEKMLKYPKGSWQELLHDLQSPVQNENVGALVKLFKISRG
jgi:hypothetical protein